MLQRRIIVATKRKSQAKQCEDFYGEQFFEAYEMDDISSLLAKRLKVDSDDEINETNVKRNCADEAKIIVTVPGLEIYSQQQPKQLIQNEIKSTQSHNQSSEKVKTTSSIIHAEFKNATTGEINYLDLMTNNEIQQKIKHTKKKSSKGPITKKIHKK